MRKPIRIQGITFISVLSCMLAVPILRQPAAAQSIFGAIVGTVTDATGAVIPGAKVTATNIRTNEKRGFTTNEFGTYELNNLFPGTYLLEAERAGFVKYRQENVELVANQNIRVLDTPLIPEDVLNLKPRCGNTRLLLFPCGPHGTTKPDLVVRNLACQPLECCAG